MKLGSKAFWNELLMYLSSFGPAVHAVNSLLWSYCIRDQILLFVSPVCLPEVVCKSVKKSCSNRYRCGVFAKSLQRLPEEGLELKLLGCFYHDYSFNCRFPPTFD